MIEQKSQSPGHDDISTSVILGPWEAEGRDFEFETHLALDGLIPFHKRKKIEKARKERAVIGHSILESGVV